MLLSNTPNTPNIPRSTTALTMSIHNPYAIAY